LFIFLFSHPENFFYFLFRFISLHFVLFLFISSFPYHLSNLCSVYPVHFSPELRELTERMDMDTELH